MRTREFKPLKSHLLFCIIYCALSQSLFLLYLVYDPSTLSLCSLLFCTPTITRNEYKSQHECVNVNGACINGKPGAIQSQPKTLEGSAKCEIVLPRVEEGGEREEVVKETLKCGPCIVCPSPGHKNSTASQKPVGCCYYPPAMCLSFQSIH